MGHLTKPSNELIYDLILKANPDLMGKLQIGHLSFDAPIPQQPGSSTNSSVVARGLANAQGIGYRGARTFRYDRLNMAVKMPPDDAQTLEVMVPNDGFETKLEVVDRLNKKYDLMIGAADIVDGPVDVSVLPAKTTIVAKASSLAWTGQLTINFVPDRPFYKDTFSTQVLDGLPMPEVTDPALDTPVASSNLSPTFAVDGKLYQPGDGAYPADHFAVSRNPEVEVALAPRIGTGEVATAPTAGFEYALTLAGAADWMLCYSVGSREEPAVDVLQRYRIIAQITGPDGSELMLTVTSIDDALWFANADQSIKIAVTTAVGDLVLQGALSMNELSAKLGEVMRNGAGAPLGKYTLRLMARRINSVVPRVLASCAARVIN